LLEKGANLVQFRIEGTLEHTVRVMHLCAGQEWSGLYVWGGLFIGPINLLLKSIDAKMKSGTLATGTIRPVRTRTACNYPFLCDVTPVPRYTFRCTSEGMTTYS
jgi:hypothetical protein